MTAILPQARTVFLDQLGNPLSGGLVYTYELGTTTPKSTFQDRAQTIANSNPIVLDAAGSALIWGTGTYTMVVKNSVGSVVYTGDTAAEQIDQSAVTITGGAINGTPIGQTIPAPGRFSVLTVTGGIDATPIGGVTPSSGAFTTLAASGAVTLASTLAVTGQATVPAATASTSAVNLGQVKGTTPFTGFNSATGTTCSATSASFTAPSKGNLIIEVHGQADTSVLNTITAATSLAGMVTQTSSLLGNHAIRFAYLPMNAGDVTTVTGTVGASASVALTAIIRAFFQPAP